MVSVIVGLLCLRYRDATPETTVQAVIDSLNSSDWKGVFSRFEGAKVDEAVAVLTKLVKQDPNFPKFTIKIKTPIITGTDATLPVSVGISDKARPGSEPFKDEQVTLRETSGDWKVVSSGNAQGFFSQLSQLAKDPNSLGKADASARSKTLVLSKMKQISLAILMYTSDHNDKYSVDQATLKAKLNPYIKNDQIWIGPDGKPLDFQFNPSLIGKPLSSVKAPAQCVLLTLGPKSKLKYDNDVTPIAFVDGHVKTFHKEMISTLQWH
jgi:prepilin-type processing-associated H-X9-DG protein